ncbi:hypothetical protein ASG90_11715 [Nocardioides sp. Soil797]|nr:hypothetical protein ASG90_11715 [Nocardioides sp. Soil797]
MMASVTDQQREEPHPEDPASPYPTQPYPYQQYPAQQYPAQPYPYPTRPYPGSSSVAHPPKPETTLRAPLVWTAAFSFVGVVLLVGVLIVLVVLLMCFVYLMFALAGGAESWDFGGFLADFFGPIMGAALVIVVVVSVLSFLACAGVLLLLRLISDIRRWPSPLQALLACALTYVGGGTVVWILGQLLSATGS